MKPNCWKIPQPPNIQTLKQGKSIMVDILMAQVRPFIKYFEYSYTMSDKNQEIEKNVSEQAGIEGQRKEVNVEDYPKAVALGQILKDIDFPADKQKVIQHVQQRFGSNADSQSLLSTLQNIEDKEYHNVAEVTKAAGVVYT